MNIAFVISSMSSGGAERVVANLANKLNKNGHKINIITFNNDKSFYKLDKGVEHFNYKYKNKGKIITLINAIKCYKSAFKEIKPDIIISFLTTVNIISIIANLFIGIPLIISERNDPNKNPKEWYYKLLRKLLYRFANGYVFQTSDAKKYFSKSIQFKSKIIHNPVYVEEKIIKKERKIKDEIVSVGRLEYQKNYKLLIDAYEIINNKFKDYKLIIYGEGALRIELEKYIEKKGLKDKVLLPGNDPCVHYKIKDSKLFILSSDYEGMPNALMEAMALGLPCISTDCPIGGASELISNGKNGILIENNNLNELVKWMEVMLTDDRYRERIAIEAKKISYSHNIEIICKEWEDYIINILKK